MATATAPKAPANAGKKSVKNAPPGIVSDPIADMLTRIRNANGALRAVPQTEADNLP